MTETPQYPFADLNLSRRLEQTEAQANLEFVEARNQAFPDYGAEWTSIGSAFAMFDGPESPLTQTFCLGINHPTLPSDLLEIEEFYAQKNAPVFHEVSPLADLSTIQLLMERGYRPLDFTSVMYRPIDHELRLGSPKNEALQVRLIKKGEERLWADTSYQGWSEFSELADFLKDLGEVHAKSRSLSFIAELNEAPVATGILCIHEGCALLAGASTIPAARKQGAQLALLESRLRYAAEQGCDIAMMCALPGSASQRNAERHGFRIAYTRIKWHQP